MPFLGYILPPKNQKAYDRDVALAVKNYKNDILSKALVKPTASQPIVMQAVKQESPQAIAREILNDIISSATEKSETKSKAVKQESSQAIARDILNDIFSKVETTSSAAKRPLSPLVKELEAKLASPKLGLKSKNLTVDTTVPDIEIEGKPSPTETSTTSLESDDTWESLLDKYSDYNQKEFNENAVLNEQALNLLKNAIANKQIVYGVNSGNQGIKNKKDFILDLNEKGNIIFKKPAVNRKGFNSSFLGQTIGYNKEIQSLSGQGMKKVTGVRKYNSEENFGKYNLSLKALRKGNLTIYRPSSNHVLINRKNISPRLIKMINEIRSKMKFELEDYDNLKKSEQMVIDQIINLLRMDYPPKMRRTLDEEVWNLKQRYEILISEINAGNDGQLIKDELKDVLAKLKELKVITKRKYDFIVKAIS